jgi:hypothetical protein
MKGNNGRRPCMYACVEGGSGGFKIKNCEKFE